MSDELTGLILGAVEAAESGDDGGGDLADSGSDGAGDGAGSAIGAGEAAATADEAAGGGADGGDATPGQPAVTDPLTSELEELGLRTPEPGSNNRIPYPRVRKIVENAIKKREEAHKQALADLTNKHSTDGERARAADRVDELIATDLPRYFQMIETLHPKAKGAIEAYRKSLQPQVAVAEKPAQEVVAAEAPPFDHKFEDGSLGYTPEGYRKYQQWVMDSAEARATARATALFEQKYGSVIQPLVTREQDRAHRAQAEAMLSEKVSEASKVWGALFSDDWKKGDEGDIAKFARVNPKASFEQVIAAVLVPKLQAERTKVRKEVLDEGNVRAAAASKNTSAGKVPESSKGPVSLDDQIKAAMAEAGIG